MDNSTFLEKIKANLTNKGYTLQTNIKYGDYNFEVVGHLAKIELSKFGKNDYFFVVGEIKETTLDSIRSFSSQAFDYSGQHRVNKLPPGLFGGYWVFPIILVDQIENSVMNAVQQEDPPKHYSSAEFPIVIEKTTKKVYYFQRTPTWGAAFYAGFRQLASEIASL